MKSRFAFFAVAALLFARMAFAQTSSGEISGRVIDSSDSVVVDAQVTLTNQDTGDVRETRSDRFGNFLFPALQPGVFRVAVRAASFQGMEKRDLKLKHALSEQVRLVRFRPGHLELNPLPNAPKELGQDLMRKLKAWTGRVWIVALSGDEGAAPLGVQRREREAREIERIRDHPDVKQVLQHFPGARIAAVRATASEEPAGSPVSPAEIDEGAETEFKEDGTDP